MLAEKNVVIDNRNYYFDIRTRERVARFYPGVFFNLTFDDGSVVNIPPENVNASIDGCWFKIDGVKYNIQESATKDDVRYGYFTHGDYDSVQETNLERGIKARQEVVSDLEQAFTEYLHRHPEIVNPKITEKGNNFSVSFDYGSNAFTVAINSVNNTVNKNQYRKRNGQKYLPYNPNMDKFNSYYMIAQVSNVAEQLSLFGRPEGADRLPKVIIDDICDEIVNIINNPQEEENCYHYDDYKFVIVE